MSMLLENWTIEKETGYRPISSFYTSFSIADKFGPSSILETFKRAFAGWRNRHKYVTELAMVMNWKSWRWHNINEEYSKLYTTLFEQINSWIMTNLKGEELDYYISTTNSYTIRDTKVKNHQC